jgi:diacylglycerol kinase family enzyme
MKNPHDSAVIIANPMAGRKQPSMETAWIHELLPNLKGAKLEFAITRHAGHAEDLAHRASLQGVRWIVAAGGDGTIHDVLNGMMRNRDNQSILGLAPCGTANDYAASFPHRGLSINSCQPTPVDIGLLTWPGGTRFFINVASIGISGLVANTARRLKRYPPRLRYTLALAMQLGPGFGARPYYLGFDHATRNPTECLLLSVAIGKREGSYSLHPDADVGDGLFDVLKLGRLTRRELIWYFPAMLRGILPKDHPQVERLRCTRLELASAQPIPMHLDGENPYREVSESMSRFGNHPATSAVALDRELQCESRVVNFSIDLLPKAIQVLPPICPLRS